MSEGVNAAIFYLSVAALVGGTIRALRASVERHGADRIGIGLATAGAVGLAAAVVAFLHGPRTLLPF